MRSREGAALPFATEIDYGRWLSAWYQVLRTLPSARGVRSDLWVLPPPKEEGDLTVYGTYDEVRDVITVGCLVNRYDMLATLLHEMAHATTTKWSRSHGYRWRRAFGRLAEELLGANPMPLARSIRQRRNDAGYIGSQQSALDAAVTVLLTEQRVRLVDIVGCDDHGEICTVAALAGGRLVGIDEDRVTIERATFRADPGPLPASGVPEPT